MKDWIDKKVQVGQKLAKYNQQDLQQGLYLYKDYVFASNVGVVKSNSDKYFVENKFPVKCFDIKVGDIIYGQISKIRQQQAFVNLIQINNISLSKNIQGTIRKQHVRQKLIDQVVMIDSFRPNDIIKAKVISLGDSSRSLYLTTAAEDLGVVVAKAEQSGRLMLPYDWTSMIDLNGNHQQKRKVAKPQI